MNRNRVTAALAVSLTLVLAPTLTACTINPIESIIEGATGGDVELPTAGLPKGFPTDVPLIDGEVTFGTAFGDGANTVFNVTVKVDGLEAYDSIKTQLEEAGFQSAITGTAGPSGSGAFSNNDWGVLVVVSEDASDGFLANYTVTSSNQT